MKTGNTTSGISFSSLLLIAFIVLKLTHYIDWSWLWVLSPAWIPLAFVVVILGIVRILTVIAKAIK